jgi:hypothetical protein
LEINKKTGAKDAFNMGHNAFYQGMTDVAPKKLNVYAQKEWVRGWNKAYFKQREYAEKHYAS